MKNPFSSFFDKAKASVGFSADILGNINGSENKIKNAIINFYKVNNVKEGNQYPEDMMVQGVKSLLYDEYYKLKEKGKKDAYKYFFVEGYYENNIKNAITRLRQLLVRSSDFAFKVESYKRKAENEFTKHNLDAAREYQAKTAEYENYLKEDEASLKMIYDRYAQIFDSKKLDQEAEFDGLNKKDNGRSR